MTDSARIMIVTLILRSIISTSLKAHRKQNKHHVDNSVMVLLDDTVKALFLHSLDGLESGKVEDLVERIVESTLQDEIPRYEGIRKFMAY